MIIDKSWSVLTVGDGDLSFSYSLLQHHKPKKLVATVLDSKQSLLTKYPENNYQELVDAGCQVICEFDVTEPNTWQNVPLKQFDLVIFQFPLVPGFINNQHYQECKEQLKQSFSLSTFNRRLLRLFLKHSCEHWLHPNGQGLMYISSKQVKPYIEWDIERSLNHKLDCDYLGSMPFHFSEFPGYLIRNVDRDKRVKQTESFTYIWQKHASQSLINQESLNPVWQQTGDVCTVCKAGPFTNNEERLLHQQTPKHQRLTEFHEQWLYYLDNIEQ